MSEMQQPENQNIQPNQEAIRPKIEAYLQERYEWMGDAVELLAGDRNADPAVILPAAKEVRAQGEDPGLGAEQESALREIAGRFGIGGEVDIVSAAQVQILEGGKPWKVEAEAQIAGAARTVLFAGSPNRKIGQDELDYMQAKLGGRPVGETEYDMVRQIAELQAGFEPMDEPEALPYGYDIANNFTLIPEATGQLVKIGHIGDQAVILLRVDRENYIDEEGIAKYRNQPDSAALMSIVGKVLTAGGDDESSVAINSSTTYASRAVDTARAGLRSGRTFEVGMYGRRTLADVRGLPVAEPTEINQIPGELHEMHIKLQQLQAELEATK